MSKYSKWLGGILGWGFGGPIGAILGFALGAMLQDNTLSAEERAQRKTDAGRYRTPGGDFNSALLVLSAAVMKADGRLMRSELEFVRSYFSKAFGPQSAAEQIGLLKEILKQAFDEREVCRQVRHIMPHPSRLQLLHYLFGIAASDGSVDVRELSVIEQMAHDMGISDKDSASIKAMHFKDPNGPYKILEIETMATDEEVKKAYRRMAVKYHPDKVRDLGDEHMKQAQEKFVKVSEAYEQIKKDRGMK